MDDQRAGKADHSHLAHAGRYFLLFAVLGAMLSAWLEWTAGSRPSVVYFHDIRLETVQDEPIPDIGSGAALGGAIGALAALLLFRK